MDNQISLFDIDHMQMASISQGSLSVVKAQYTDCIKVGWHELFDGFDELYGITYSSGLRFMENLFDSFEHVDLIFGCEGLLNDDLATIISAQIKSVEQIVKSKSAKNIAERMQDGSIDLSVSRDTKSHEKIYILKAKDGRVRVITGSANMSASAFQGIQREDIICFDDQKAFDYYKGLFDEFKEKCADSVSEKLFMALHDNVDYVRDNIQETPIIKTIEKRKVIILEPADKSDEEEIVADIKGLEAELKPLLPKVEKEKGRIIISGDTVKAFKRKYEEKANVKKVQAKRLPKLHIDYEGRRLLFNGKEQNLEPTTDDICRDISSIFSFIDSLSSFHGDYKKSQSDYYKFLNWYFASPFMPYLRYVGSKNDYSVISFPVVGILYGASNGGKSTFIKLLSKLMSGKNIPPNKSSDFTGKSINYLKVACEGVPINIDDLAKAQYDANFEKVIKDDHWGIIERYVNYPSVAISTNKLAALKPDISKRVVTCRIDIRIDKESGVYSSKRINDSMKNASNSFFCEYVRRMFKVIEEMETEMREGNELYFPDILKESSKTIKDIIEDQGKDIPEYVRDLTYSDYFGDIAVGKYALDQIKTAWETEPKMFKVDKKKNRLIYSYPDGGRLYELKYLQEELPPSFETQLTSRSLVMKLDAVEDVLGITFKRFFW